MKTVRIFSGVLCDVEAVALLACRTGLVGLELHAQDVGGQTTHVVDGLGDFDATTLAATTGMDLCLDHPDGAAQFFGCSDSFVNGKGRNSSWDRHAKSAQDLFALVFMNFHGALAFRCCVLVEHAKSASSDQTEAVAPTHSSNFCAVQCPAYIGAPTNRG